MDKAGRCRCRLLAALRSIQFRNDDDSFRVSIRKLTEKNCVNHTEDCRVSPDAKREGEHGHGGEPGVLQQLAKGEFEIIHNAEPPSDRYSQRVERESKTRTTL